MTDQQSLSTILENATKAINEAKANGGDHDGVPEHGRAAAMAITKYGKSAATYLRKTASEITTETEAELAQIRAELAKFTTACEDIAGEIERAAEHKAGELVLLTQRIKRAALGVQETSREYLATDGPEARQ